LSQPWNLARVKYTLRRLASLRSSGAAKGEAFYDRMYDTEAEYGKDFRDSMYLAVWAQVYSHLRQIPDARVLEVGCGSGQFASFLQTLGFTGYVRGFDLSSQAVETARRRVSYQFDQGDATRPENYRGDYNTVVSLETVEHIPDDFSMLVNIPAGTTLVMTLPDFEYESHYRWFTNPRQIEKRYYRYLDIRSITKIQKWYVVLATGGSFQPGWLHRVFRTRRPVNGSFFWERYFRPALGYMVRPLLRGAFSR